MSGSDESQGRVEALAAAVAAATDASAALRSAPPARLAALLEGIAVEVEARGGDLVEAADRETHLGRDRLVGELARTTGQLRRLASFARTGRALEVTIDRADLAAVPPRPDLRRMGVPVGPVAVFPAGNFPLAFGVAGGDTAAALASGCPVVVKPHPGYPSTSALTAAAVRRAVDAAGLPSGTFGCTPGDDRDIGAALVLAPGIAAVAFTGSTAAGRALFDLAASRPEPIPVFAEMGSTNPVFLTPSAVRARGPALAEGFVASMSMGAGQLCTKPGLVFLVAGDDANAFVDAVAHLVRSQPAAPMLGREVRERLDGSIGRVLGGDGVRVAATGGEAEDAGFVAPMLLATDLATFDARPELREELFGPVALLVRCPDEAALIGAAATVDGSLTATVHAAEVDAATSTALRDALVGRAGRVVFGGWPTGVAVTAAMHHGGPYPSTTAPWSTSVGDAAVRRFLRAVAFQSWPDALLPPALQDANPLGLERLVDGQWTSGAIQATRSLVV